MASWLSSFFGEYEARPLQRSGPLTKEQLLQFFEAGKILFDNLNFKIALAKAHQQGASAQDLINEAQTKIWEEKVQPAVQGDYGLQSLSQVLALYQNDAPFLRAFYEFVHLEEKALDEAEMDPAEFEKKYQQLEEMKARMQQEVAKHEEATKGMTQEQKDMYMANTYRMVLESSLGAAGPACCSGGTCRSGAHAAALPPDPMQAPAVEGLQAHHDHHDHCHHPGHEHGPACGGHHK